MCAEDGSNLRGVNKIAVVLDDVSFKKNDFSSKDQNLISIMEETLRIQLNAFKDFITRATVVEILAANIPSAVKITCDETNNSPDLIQENKISASVETIDSIYHVTMGPTATPFSPTFSGKILFKHKGLQ